MTDQLLIFCTKCGEPKPPTEEFFKPVYRCENKRKFRSHCRECDKAKMRELYLRNTQKYKDRAKHREIEKKAEIKAYKAAKYLANIDHEKAVRKAWREKQDPKVRYQQMKARMAADPQFRAQQNLGARFRQLIKNKPQGGLQRIVGYSYADLKRHLERQFDDEMSWENYGSYWEVDHILPVKSFNLPDEAAACWALTNLRPLHKQKNRQKSAQRLFLL